MTTPSIDLGAAAPAAFRSASVRPAPMLVAALRADALASGGVALLQLAFGDFVATTTGLPRPLVFATGAFMVGYVVLLLVLAAAPGVRRALVRVVVIGNVLWAVGCLALAAVLSPGAPGIAYLALQAATVLPLAAWEGAGLRRSVSLQ